MCSTTAKRVSATSTRHTFRGKDREKPATSAGEGRWLEMPGSSFLLNFFLFSAGNGSRISGIQKNWRRGITKFWSLRGPATRSSEFRAARGCHRSASCTSEIFARKRLHASNVVKHGRGDATSTAGNAAREPLLTMPVEFVLNEELYPDRRICRSASALRVGAICLNVTLLTR